MQRSGRWAVSDLMRLLAIVSLLVLIHCSSDSGDDDTDTPSITDVALVLTHDSDTGSYTVVDLEARDTFTDIALGGIHSDAIARFFNGRIYVVNRLGADNIQLIDPLQGYTTPPGGQLSVGNGLNPQDIAFVNANRAYVSRLRTPRLLVINPTALTVQGEVDLSALTKPNDSDGAPETAYMLVHNGLLYVALQHIDFAANFIRVASGEVVVINPATDAVVTVIVLNGENPFSELQFSPALNRIVVSSVGDFGVNDGGIEAIDPVTNTVETIIDEATIGGDITHFQIVSATKGYAIVTDANFANALVSFNPSTGQRLATLVGPVNVFVPHFAVNSRNELYLAVNDTTTPTPGVRIFNTVTDTEITTTPLNVGELPPAFVLFIE
jgi:hypothetical protein